MPEVSNDRGSLVLRLDRDETRLMHNLIDEMRSLLRADIPRSDAVMNRLFPRAYQMDEDEDPFAEMTHDPLRQARLRALDTVHASLKERGTTEAELGRDEADSWVRVLTDMRVAIGTRLEVDEDRMAEEIDPSDPDAPALSVLHWLGWVQSLLLDELGGV